MPHAIEHEEPSKIAAVSVDVDALRCYHAIHGLGHHSLAMDPVYHHALPRLLELFDQLRVAGTIFVIGQDLVHASNRRILREVADRHELASHSMTHPYNLFRLPAAQMREELRRSRALLEDLTGAGIYGFRSPGYGISTRLMHAIEEEGYLYDSSILPSPAYQAAKLGVMLGMHLVGRTSQSAVHAMRTTLGPTQPYRMDSSVWRRGSGLLQLPIGVTPRARLPFTGTSLALAGERGARWLTHAMLKARFVHLELHALDLLDAQDDGISYLIKHQPELRCPLTTRRRIFANVIETLRDAGYQILPLRDAAQTLLNKKETTPPKTNHPTQVDL